MDGDSGTRERQDQALAELPAGWWRTVSGWQLVRSRGYGDWQAQLVLLVVVVAMCGAGVWASNGKLAANLTILGLYLAFIVLVVRPRQPDGRLPENRWSAWWGMALAVAFSIAVFLFREPTIWFFAAFGLFSSMWLVVPVRYRWAPYTALFLLGIARLVA